MTWATIVGQRDDGRMRFAAEVASELRRRGLSVQGFVEEPFEVDGERKGWDLVRISDEARRPLARRSPEPNLCGYHFSEAVFDEARAELDEAADVTLLTAGKLEAQGQGHWPAIESAMRSRVAVLLIRPHLLSRFAVALPDPIAALELPAPSEAIGAFVDAVEAAARAREVVPSGG